MCRLYCHKCGTILQKDSQFCSNCGVKVEPTSVVNRPKKAIWVLPVGTFIIALTTLFCFYMYEKNTNTTVQAMIKDGEKRALEGELTEAKTNFRQVLEKRPNNKIAAFNLELVERGQRYEKLLGEATKFAEDELFYEGLRILEDLERELALEEGRFFEQFQELISLKIASLTVASFSSTAQEKKGLEELVELLEKTKQFSSDEALIMTDILKEKITDLSISQGKKYLRKHQFTEAILEFNRGLFYDPKNEELLHYKEKVKNEQLAFSQREEQRMKKAKAQAAKEEQFNWTKAIKSLSFEYSDGDNGELTISGKVKNIGTRPVTEIDTHYIIYDEEGNEILKSWATVSPQVLLPKEIGYFEETLFLSVQVGTVKVTDYYWSVQ